MLILFYSRPHTELIFDTKTMLKRRRRVKDIEDAVKVAATKSDDDFIREYLVRYDRNHTFSHGSIMMMILKAL